MPYNEKSKQNLLQNTRKKSERKAKYEKAKEKGAETRKKNIESREAALLILSLNATGKIEENLRDLGVPVNERTNLMAVFARLFTMAMSGDLKAMEMLFKYARFDPELDIKVKLAEAKVEAVKNGIEANLGEEGGGDNDVIIYSPDNNRPVLTSASDEEKKNKQNNGADMDAPFLIDQDNGDGE